MDTLCSRTGRPQQYPSIKTDWLGKVCDHNPDIYAVEESDTGIVPKKTSNKAGQPGEETPEGRPVTKGKY